MRLSDLTLALGIAAIAQPALAWPANKLLEDIKARQADPNNDGDPTPIIIGDLQQGATTPVGQSVYNILMRTEDATSQVGGYKPPGKLNSAACGSDTCCPWYYLSKDLTGAFRGFTGRCNDLARACIRLGFHDAGAWQQGLSYGGADGSIALDGGVEMSRAENNGLQSAVAFVQKIKRSYPMLGMADIIQFASIHATVTCPLGPRTRFFAGRQDSTKPAAKNLLPDVNASADVLIKLFEDKTIPPHDLVALVGAHSTSKQFFVDRKKSGWSQDTTPGVWDVAFYRQTLTSPAPHVFQFASDLKLSKDKRTSDEWHQFTDPVNGQSHWIEDYANAYVRLSLLGVNVINQMTECTKVLPPYIPFFLGAGIPYIDQKA